jgi:hypothetical protein
MMLQAWRFSPNKYKTIRIKIPEYKFRRENLRIEIFITQTPEFNEITFEDNLEYVYHPINFPKIYPYIKKYLIERPELYINNLDNYPITNLPENITKLSLLDSRFFGQPLINLPSNLTHLTLEVGNDFTDNMDYLPNSMQYLSINYYEPHYHALNDIRNQHPGLKLFNLPSSLKTFIFKYTPIINNLSHSVTDVLEIVYPVNLEEVYIDIDVDLNLIPDNVSKLHIHDKNIIPIMKLPKNIRHIYIPYSHTQINNLETLCADINHKPEIIRIPCKGEIVIFDD